MNRLTKFYHRISCRLGRCGQCRFHDTDDGIGGQCIHCGRLHGWMTRDELLALLAGV